MPVCVAAAPASAGLPGGPLLPRGELALGEGLIHFNTASLGPSPRAVLAATIAAWSKLESDPVAMAYSPAPGTVRSDADAVRGKAAALLGCDSDEVLLTRGTTDGVTTIANSIRLMAGDRVLLTDREHEGGETGWLHRAGRDGLGIDRVSIPSDLFDPGEILGRFAAAIGPRTRVIVVSHVLSANGLLMPIAQIAALARGRGVLCVVDGAQSAGAIPVDVRALGCDAYATSGHKWLLGPKGTGIAYIAKAAADRIAPPQWLTDHSYGANSAGLGALTLMAGLGAAIDRMSATGMERVAAHNLDLRNRLYAALVEMPQIRVVSPPPGPLATPLVAAVLPAEIDSKDFRGRLQRRHGIVLKMAEKRWFNGFRLSPHLFNDAGEVDLALAAIRATLTGWGRGD